MHSITEPDEPQSLLRVHWILSNVCHQFDVLERSQTGDQVVELKNESNVFPTVTLNSASSSMLRL